MMEEDLEDDTVEPWDMAPEPEIDRLIDRLISTASGSYPWISQTHWEVPC